MTGLWTSTVFTSEFRREYEAEREQWLRRRFLWYTGVVGGLNLFGFLVALMLGVLWRAGAFGAATMQDGAPAGTAFAWLDAVADGLLAAIFLLALRYGLMRPTLKREKMLSLAFWLIVISGGVRLTLGAVVLEQEAASGASAAHFGGAVGVGGAIALLSSHLIACLFLPWTPKESFRPLLPLLVLNALMTVWYSQSIWLTALVIAVSPLIGAPGMLVCWWRYSRFHDRFNVTMLRRRYTELKRDLVNARQIHESLFPPPMLEGDVRFTYQYEPMRQIGGDYLFACETGGASGGNRALNIVLIDVTGHGIPAALTVNRLHGELERIFAEDPASSPGEVLRLLNRYVHLTLARHSVYASAICLRVEHGRDVLQYASAGHPPAFVRAVDGTVERLDSTTFVLGVTMGDDFEPGARTVRFGPGDTLIAYTDGAIEARDRSGRVLGIDGLQRLIASQRIREGGWADVILRAADHHRYGGNDDDTLVVEVWRPLTSPGRSSPPPLPAQAPAAAPAATPAPASAPASV